MLVIVNKSRDETMDENKPVSYQLRILASIRRIIRAIDISSRKVVKEYNLTTPQHVCLLTIVEEGPLTVSELGRQAALG